MNCPQRSRLRVPTSQTSAPPDPQSQSTAPPPPGPQPRPARPLSTTCNAHSNPSTPLQLLPQAPAVSPWTTLDNSNCASTGLPVHASETFPWSPTLEDRTQPRTTDEPRMVLATSPSHSRSPRPRHRLCDRRWGLASPPPRSSLPGLISRSARCHPAEWPKLQLASILSPS